MTANHVLDIFIGIGILLLIGSVGSRIHVRSRLVGSYNPISLIWGQRVYKETILEEDELLIDVGQMTDDEYMVRWKIKMYESYRERGPKWVRKEKLIDLRAEWEAIERGIPTNHGYIKDTWGGDFRIEDPVDWRYTSCLRLEELIREKRRENGFVGEVLETRSDDEGVYITSKLFDQDVNELLLRGVVGGMSIGYSAQEVDVTLYDGFGAPITAPSPKQIKEARIVSWGPDQNGLGAIISVDGVDVADNEKLKQQYTIEELAQQAVNRDKEED